MLVPTIFIISKYGPGKWLPACEVCLTVPPWTSAELKIIWGCLTCVLSVSKNAQTASYGMEHSADRADLRYTIPDRILRGDVLAWLQHHHRCVVSPS